MIKGILGLWFSCIIIGLGIALAFKISWVYIPSILIGLFLYAVSCYKIAIGD